MPPEPLRVVPLDSAKPEPGSALDYALKYAGIGWHVFPVWGAKNGRCCCAEECKSPGKHPVEHLARRGQDDATLDVDTIRRWWSAMPAAAIGVPMKASGLVALDIDPRHGGFETMDDLEARHGPIRSDVTQFSQGGGEHRVFKLPSSMGDSALPGKLGPGVDVKLNGYIILEPSRGVVGAYTWEASSNPLDGVIPSPLPDFLRDLARAAPLAGPISTRASRFITDQQIGELRDALRHLPADDRDAWIRYCHALHALGQVGYDLWTEWSQKSAKFDPVDQTRTWRSAKPAQINFESIFFDAQASGWINPLAGTCEALPVQVIAAQRPAPPKASAIREEHPTEFPVAILNRITEWMEGFSEEPNRSITMQGVLALASVLAGRIYESDNRNVASAYFLTLSPTGTGKGYPKEAIRKLLSEAGLTNMLSGSGNTSAGAVFSALFRAPTHIQISDEFGKHLQLARKQVNGAMADAFSVMVEAYSDASGLLVPRNYSHFHLSKKEMALLDTKIVRRPAITLYAFATPEQVFENLTSMEIDDGFLNRLIAVNVTSGNLPDRKLSDKSVPNDFITWAKTVRRIGAISASNLAGMETDYDLAPVPVRVEFTPGAWRAFAQFKAEIRGTPWLESKLTMRWRENAMRVATALAVAENAGHPAVTELLAAWAIGYVRSHGVQFMRAVVVNIADSDYHRLYVAIKGKIEEAGAAGVTERELSRASRLFCRTQPALRDQVFAALVRDEVAVKVSFSGPSGRGKKRDAFVLASHASQASEGQNV